MRSSIICDAFNRNLDVPAVPLDVRKPVARDGDDVLLGAHAMEREQPLSLDTEFLCELGI